MKFHVEQMNKMLDWFESINVNQWNIAVLEKSETLNKLIVKHGRMIGHDKNRNRIEANKCIAWIAAQNLGENKGIQRDCYIRPAWHCPDGSLASWPVVFLDDVSEINLSKIKTNALIIKTSNDRHHVWLAVDQSLTVLERKLVQQKLQPLFNADPGSISGEHFGRCAGYKNIKRSGCWVSIKKIVSGISMDVSDLLTQPIALMHPKKKIKFTSAQTSKINTNKSESEREFGYVISRIRYAIFKGADMNKVLGKLERELVQTVVKRGKHSNIEHAMSYARTTVYNAQIAAREGILSIT